MEPPKAPERVLLVAYDACLQVCLSESLLGSEPSARTFLDNRCGELQRAFGLGRTLLVPAGMHGGAPHAMALPPAHAMSVSSTPAREQPARREPPSPITVQVGAVKWDASLKKQVAQMIPASVKGVVRRVYTPESSVTSVTVRLDCVGGTSTPAVTATEEVPLTLVAPAGIASADALVVEATSTKGRHGCARIPIPGIASGVSGAVTLRVAMAGGAVCGSLEIMVTLQAASSLPPAPTVGGTLIAAGEAFEDDWRTGAVNATAAYDTTLEAALRASRFGRRRLPLATQWAWLLNRLALTHALSEPYCAMRYMQHVMSAATPTADCLQIVLDNLSPVTHRGEGSLSQQEARMLSSVRESVDRLLAQALEHYKQLCESVPSGVAEGGLPAGTPVPSPALALTVQLFSLLHDPLSPDSQRVLASHLRAGANKCYWRQAAAAQECAAADCSPADAFQDSFSSLSRLCVAIGEELRVDLQVHAAEVLPAAAELPLLAAEEYCRELGAKLRGFLDNTPPPRPSAGALELLDAVGDLQDKLSGWNLAGPSTGPVEPETLFGAHVRRWIGDSRVAMVECAAAWGAAPPRTGTDGAAAVQDLYCGMHAVLSEYERVASRWPVFTIDLEGAIADAERTMLKAIEGWVAPLMGPRAGHAPPPAAPAHAPETQHSSNMRKRFFGAVSHARHAAATLPAALRRGPAKPAAFVGGSFGGVPAPLAAALVALKAMETLRPDYHARLRRWAQAGGSRAEDFGRTFLVIGQEIRGQYMDYMLLAVDRAAGAMRTSCNIRGMLQSLPADVDAATAFTPAMEAVRCSMTEFERGVGRGRVLVGLTRGLWDGAAADVLSYLVEDCKENSSWRQRITAGAAVEALSATFAEVLQALLGHDLKDDDLRPPEHAKRVTGLQSNNLASSFSMY